jgi:3-oxoacyl-[acyl-carrier protein] reductase
MTVAIDLSGRKALVTGASRGIGRDAAVRLAEAGADVACVATNQQLLDEVCAIVRNHGRKAICLKCDVGVVAEVEATVEKAVAELGGLDILVNNAGITRDNLLMRMKEEDWDKVIDVDLKGPFAFMKAASRALLRSKYPRIINVSSVAGILGNPGQANYSAAKGGLISLTKTAAREYGGRGILVNAVAPGFIKTDMSSAVDPKVIEQAVANIPLKRMGEPREIADAIVFLASDLAKYVTGQVLVVDGGMAM